MVENCMAIAWRHKKIMTYKSMQIVWPSWPVLAGPVTGNACMIQRLRLLPYSSIHCMECTVLTLYEVVNSLELSSDGRLGSEVVWLQ